MRYIDLHVHSNFSDGHFEPKQLVEFAHQNQVKMMAIADHDSIQGLTAYKEALQSNIMGVNAVEISSKIAINDKLVRLHILGYGFNENDRALLSVLDELKQKRLIVHHQLLSDLKKNFSSLPLEHIAHLDFEKYCWFDREIFRCIKKNISDADLINQYATYFKNNKLHYGKDYETDVRKVIEAINNAGGISVLAHPMSYRLPLEDVKPIISRLVDMGIMGIEAFQSDCNYNDSIELLKEVKRYQLLYSAGSDFHRLVKSDGREIGHGINQNLCIEETTLSNKILEKKLYFKGGSK